MLLAISRQSTFQLKNIIECRVIRLCAKPKRAHSVVIVLIITMNNVYYWINLEIAKKISCSINVVECH